MNAYLGGHQATAVTVNSATLPFSVLIQNNAFLTIKCMLGHAEK